MKLKVKFNQMIIKMIIKKYVKSVGIKADIQEDQIVPLL